MSDQATDTTITKEKYQSGRKNAMMLAWVVYGGVVIAASTLFISFVLTAFPPTAYVSRAIMTAAGLLIGLSMISFPYALHYWAVDPTHRTWTAVLYYIEIALISVNTFISFVTLLSKNAGYAAPQWAVLYEPFSIFAIIYTLAAWGTVFLTDPHHKSTVKGLRALQDFDDKVADKLVSYVNSARGADRIAQVADTRIGKMFEDKDGNDIPDVFERRNVRQPDLEEIKKVAIPEDVYKQLLIDAEVKAGQGSANGNGHVPTDPTSQSRR